MCPNRKKAMKFFQAWPFICCQKPYIRDTFQKCADNSTDNSPLCPCTLLLHLQNLDIPIMINIVIGGYTRMVLLNIYICLNGWEETEKEELPSKGGVLLMDSEEFVLKRYLVDCWFLDQLFIFRRKLFYIIFQPRYIWNCVQTSFFCVFQSSNNL